MDKPKVKPVKPIVQQRLKIKLGKKETAYLIANNQCYFLHNLVTNYESLIIEISNG